MECLALELVGPQMVLGFSIGMGAFDKLLSINVPWSQEFSLFSSLYNSVNIYERSSCGVHIRK